MDIQSTMILVLSLILLHTTLADVARPEAVTSQYYSNGTLMVNVAWSWKCVAKIVSAAVFADLDSDGSIPLIVAESTEYGWVNGYDPDEALAQFHGATITGTAGIAGSSQINDDSTSSIADAQLNEAGETGLISSSAKVLLPYGMQTVEAGNANSLSSGVTKESGQDVCRGNFWLKYTGLTQAPNSLCVVLYDIHVESDNNQIFKDPDDGNHGPITGPVNYNEDNSIKKGYNDIQASCASVAAGGGVTIATEAPIVTTTAAPATTTTAAPATTTTAAPESSPELIHPCEVPACGQSSPNTFFQKGNDIIRCNCRGCYENKLGSRNTWTPLERTVATDSKQTLTTEDGTFDITKTEIEFHSNADSSTTAFPWICCGQSCPGLQLDQCVVEG